VKEFSSYQYLEGAPMSARDKMERGSKFWNEGKWKTFVYPFIPGDCSEMTFIDMGCNAGVFLREAEKAGFGRIIGVDSNKEAIEKGVAWANRMGSKYDFIESGIKESVDFLPLSDYIVFSNSHYYLKADEWMDCLDKLQYKTRYVIVITAEKRHLNRCWASSDPADIRRQFRGWKEIGFIDGIPLLEGDPAPRKLWALCFQSPFIERTFMSNLDSSNHVQDDFYGEIDAGVPFNKTRYYRILRKYRESWEPGRLDSWMQERIDVYNSIKKTGMYKPILVDQNDRILDGNHRYSIMKHLGSKTVLVRRI
jgi:hypothetical protein